MPCDFLLKELRRTVAYAGLACAILFGASPWSPSWAILTDIQSRIHQHLKNAQTLSDLDRLLHPFERGDIYDYLGALNLDQMMELRPEVFVGLLERFDRQPDFRLPERYQFENWAKLLGDLDDGRRLEWVEAFLIREVHLLMKESAALRVDSHVLEVKAFFKAFQTLLEYISSEASHDTIKRLWSACLTLSNRFGALIPSVFDRSPRMGSEGFLWVSAFLDLFERSFQENPNRQGFPLEVAGTERQSLQSLKGQLENLSNPLCCVPLVERIRELENRHPTRLARTTRQAVFEIELDAPLGLLRELWGEDAPAKALEARSSFPLVIRLENNMKRPQVRWSAQGVQVDLPLSRFSDWTEEEVRDMFLASKLHQPFRMGQWVAMDIEVGLFVFFENEDLVPRLGSNSWLAIVTGYEGRSRLLHRSNLSPQGEPISLEAWAEKSGCSASLRDGARARRQQGG